MMKSLHKTFDILEFVVLNNGVPVTPGEAADALGINPATAVRIMGELVKRGYLLQVSRREGYVPGAMVVSIGTRSNQYERLAAAARGPVSELSQLLRRQVNLSVLHHGRRIMLCYRLDGSWNEAWKSFAFTNHCRTGTGRVLLASLPYAEARRISAENNRECCTEEELQEIRSKGYVRFCGYGETIIGCPVEVPGYPMAALGFGIEDERGDEALEAAFETADKIRNALIRRNIAY